MSVEENVSPMGAPGGLDLYREVFVTRGGTNAGMPGLRRRTLLTGRAGNQTPELRLTTVTGAWHPGVRTVRWRSPVCLSVVMPRHGRRRRRIHGTVCCHMWSMG